MSLELIYSILCKITYVYKMRHTSKFIANTYWVYTTNSYLAVTQYIQLIHT